MNPTAALLEPGQDQASLWLQFQHSAADPCLVIGAEKAVCAADPQIDLKIGADPAAQCFLGCSPEPDGARRSVDFNRAHDLRHTILRIHYRLVIHYYTVMRW